MKSFSLGKAIWVVSLALFVAISGCAGHGKVIGSTGLKFAKLGEEMPPMGARRFKGMQMRDSLATQGDFEWRVSRLEAKGGWIFLEEDFFMRGGINRIRIDSDRFRLANGLRVGMTVEDLRRSASPWYVSPLHDYGLFDFYTRIMPGIHFLIDDPSHPMQDMEWEKYQVENFDGLAKIVAIVVY